MKIKQTKILAVILFIVLIAASAMIYSCGKDDENTLGKGATSFTLKITDNNGTTKTFTIKTDEKTVGDALIHKDVNLIPADQKGFFSTLNGITADWEVDEGWWGFYIDGNLADAGAFDTNIEKDAVYSFKYEKGMGEWEWEDFDEGAYEHDHDDPDHTH